MDATTTKDGRRGRWARRRARHDGNHGKCGWVAGNPRYNGRGSVGVTRPDARHTRHAFRTMGLD